MRIFKNIFIVTFCLLLSSSYAQDLNSIMEEGNEHYQNKNFSEAIKSYESILNQGYLSGELYYNLGNAHFRTGNLGKAILYYEKSLKFSPGNDDAVHNLKIANARTVDKIQEIPPLFFIKWWNILLSTFTSSGWQVIIFVFYVLLLCCIALYFLAKNLQIQKFAFIFGSLNVFVLLITLILFLSSLSNESSYDYGILQKSVVTAKLSPDERSNDAFVIHEGIKFKIEEQVRDWVKIKLSDGKIGWLQENTFEVI